MFKESFMLEINNIKKYYGSFLALNNICLKLKPNELVVLLGPNGAGKSTLFSIITGLVRADSGECFINGNNVASQSIGALKKPRRGFSTAYYRSRVECKRKFTFSC